jgi:hypothetical protein
MRSLAFRALAASLVAAPSLSAPLSNPAPRHVPPTAGFLLVPQRMFRRRPAVAGE